MYMDMHHGMYCNRDCVTNWLYFLVPFLVAVQYVHVVYIWYHFWFRLKQVQLLRTMISWKVGRKLSLERHKKSRL